MIRRGAFAPMGGIYKTDVYAVARWRNDCATRAWRDCPIPENVLVKPPSAELSADQSDEESLGVDYATLDRILVEHIERGRDVDDIAGMGFDRAQVAEVVPALRPTRSSAPWSRRIRRRISTLRRYVKSPILRSLHTRRSAFALYTSRGSMAPRCFVGVV